MLTRLHLGAAPTDGAAPSMSRRIDGPRPERSFGPGRTRVLVGVALVALVVAIVSGALDQVILHAVAWPALTGGWIADQLGFDSGSPAHTVGRWAAQIPWMLAVGALAVSILRQWFRERAASAATRAFEDAHAAELADLAARVDAAPARIDAIEAEVARAQATAQALGADAWAAGAVVTRLPVRLVVERPADGFTLHAVEDGELAVRAADLRFTGSLAGESPATQVWEHTTLKLHREPTRLLLGHTRLVRPDGIPAGVQAIEPVLDQLEVLLDLARGDVDPFTARQRLVQLAEVGTGEIDRILDRGEADLARLDELEALRPGGDAAVPASLAATVWGHGAQKAAAGTIAAALAHLKPREAVEYVVRVRGVRGGPDLVLATDRRVLALSTARIADEGVLVSVPRVQVAEVAVGERTRTLTLRLLDGREVTLGRLRSSEDEIPTLFHLRSPERPVPVAAVSPDPFEVDAEAIA